MKYHVTLGEVTLREYQCIVSLRSLIILIILMMRMIILIIVIIVITEI